MALNAPNYIEKIKSSDLRECHYFLRYLQPSLSLNHAFPNNKESCLVLINELIWNHLQSFGKESAKSVLQEMRVSKEYYLLPLDKFEWLSVDNDRLIFVIWFYLRMSTERGHDRLSAYRKEPLLIFNLTSDIDDIDRIYNRISLYPSPTSTKERRTAIIDFMDKWSLTVDSKLNFMDYLKNYCHEKLIEDKKFNWLSFKNQEQASWAWNYLSSAGLPHDILKPLSATEQINSCIVTLDMWDEHPAVKELFLNKFKKAWSQKKHRDGLVGQKAYNITMSNDIQGMLETLSSHYDDKINKTLEKIIRQEYSKITHN